MNIIRGSKIQSNGKVWEKLRNSVLFYMNVVFATFLDFSRVDGFKNIFALKS